jgi:hypothetical protein
MRPPGRSECPGLLALAEDRPDPAHTPAGVHQSGLALDKQLARAVLSDATAAPDEFVGSSGRGRKTRTQLANWPSYQSSAVTRSCSVRRGGPSESFTPRRPSASGASCTRLLAGWEARVQSTRSGEFLLSTFRITAVSSALTALLLDLLENTTLFAISEKRAHFGKIGTAGGVGRLRA